MSRILRCGAVCGLALWLAGACSDDESPAPGGEAGAAGAPDGAAGTPDGAAGTPDGAAGMPPDPGGASAGGAAGATAMTAGQGGLGSGDGGGGQGGDDATGGWSAGGAAGGAGEAGAAGAGGASDPLASFTVLDVNDVKDHPEPYAWFDFRLNVKKLILAGAAETEHIAILWYTVTDGGVGLHYHAKTESVYVIDGTQTDAKGVYGDGTVYFNPPGSGHQITDSSGFFILAYAAPPDFVNTDLIEEYEPVRIDTTAADLTTTYDFSELAEGIKTYAVPLEDTGGLEAELIETSSSTPYAYEGNYLLVLKGSCDVEGVPLAAGMLVVAKTIVPEAYRVSAASGSTCLALGVSF